MNAQVRTDNMSGTVFGHDLVTLRFAADIDNGNILAVGEHEDNQREVREGLVPAAATPIAKLVLVASEEVNKEKKWNSLSEFTNKAGELIRGYRLRPGVFSITKEALHDDSDDAEVGKIASVASSTKIKLADTVGGTKVGTVIAIEGQWIVIEIE